MRERWAIFIDIEGFGTLRERDDQVLWSLGELLEDILLLGCWSPWSSVLESEALKP